ncbi:kinase-like domain-containing protein [Bisporella sp. PMI_857]|nr:kinase-like domain-containing protein [Bisporella sp. PMI_857]
MLDKAAADASYILEPAFSQQRRESLSHKATANAAYILEPTFSPQHQWSLLEKLENARHYWPIPRTDADTYFIPRDCIENLLTFEAVNDQLHRAYPGESEAWISSLTKSICLSAKRLFIILLCGGQIDSSHYIHEFIEEGITDADLPFTKYFLQKEYQTSGGNYKSVVCKKSHLTCSKKDHADCGIKALMRAGRRLDFVRRDQWIVLAPIFRPALDNTTPEMNINTIMPFIKDNEHDITLKKEGGYGEVWQVVIHPAHQRFSQVQHAKEAKIAIKRQYSTNASKFQVERDMLTTLAKKNHPHLIRLLTTYKFRNRYHFMFLWADSNLVDYWESRRLPERTPQVYLWVLEQMIGITSALSTIHNYKSSALRNQEPKVKYKEYSTAGSLQQEEVNNRFPALEEEADYGRHGDLKGQNILWFDGPNGGTLQISDLGTGRFHGLESRSNVNPNTISGSPTYSPPEVVLNKFVSRKYDIWSLGCVYSEFITWLIEGPEGIQNFADARLLYTDPNWADDKFFVLVNNIESGATLRPRVLDWFSRLRSNKRCSPMLSELLTLIQQRMLSIDSNNRISSEELLEQLEHIRIRANDVAYAI